MSWGEPGPSPAAPHGAQGEAGSSRREAPVLSPHGPITCPQPCSRVPLRCAVRWLQLQPLPVPWVRRAGQPGGLCGSIPGWVHQGLAGAGLGSPML